MSAILIYVFPVVMDMVLAGVMFMATVWAAQQGASASAVSNLITAWAAVYMVCALAIGRVVTRRNAPWLLVGACLATAGLSVGFMVARSLATMYVLMALEGAAMAVFFAPFQVFMKLVGEHKKRRITESVGLYTFSWSSGYALGPLIAGILWVLLGWAGCHAINALAAFLVAIGILVMHIRIGRLRAAAASSDSNGVPDIQVCEYAARPDLAWMAWLFGGIGCIATVIVRGIFPTSGAACDIPKSVQGEILAVFSGVQAVVGLLHSRGRRWMYRPWPILGFGLFGVAALILFAISRTPAGFMLGAACFGVYSGTFFFYFVFHSLVHPEHAGRYISINEAVVGLTGIIGPVLGGLLADTFSLSTPYLIAGGMVFVGICVQASIHARLERRAAESLPAEAVVPAA
ncbi:MAG TPA: MFS transporter [Phycisphaerae bacterium]|nr:MFS transporter [Phycisphaerae bacterium]